MLWDVVLGYLSGPLTVGLARRGALAAGGFEESGFRGRNGPGLVTLNECVDSFGGVAGYAAELDGDEFSCPG